jgi:CII-binding regulator of phage lambda lysogenization HflD
MAQVFERLDQLNSLVEDRDMLAENLENLVKKERLEGRRETLQEAEERILESKRDTANKLISRTEMNDQMIAEIADLAVDEVSRLRSEIKH